ncbi:MAG: FliM/FliN family flagellar motor C-terminal domain-containing protein [Candidatus Sulfotelmatobacter sp.]
MASAVEVNPAPANPVSVASEGPGQRLENSAAAADKGIDETRWRPLLGLPGQLTVDLPLPDFTVADLLQMAVGSVMRTGWQVARDVPLRVNGTLIGWSEFEAVGNRLAVRLTELA